MNLKELMEKRAELQARLEELANGANAETRAMNDDEVKEFDAAEAEIRAIDETLARAERARKITAPAAATATVEERAAADERAFVDYLRGRVTEMRDGEQNIDLGGNGAIIPSSIAQKVVRKVVELCPILQKAQMYHSKGALKVPVWGNANTTHNIAVGYQTELSEITADAGKFTSVDLGGYLGGALTLIGKTVVNNADIDVVGFVVNEMAARIAEFLEGELLKGSGSANSHATGAISTTNTLLAGSTSAISVDKLIELQAKVPQVYQANSCWTMNPATFTAIRQLKDGQSRYILQDNIAGAFPYMLLGKPVYISDNMPTVASAAKAVLYGDYSGLAVNMREAISIEVLRERFADMHALGVIGWFEFDSKVVDNQRLAALVMSVS